MMLKPNCLVCETRPAIWVIDNGPIPEFLCGRHINTRMEYLEANFNKYGFMIRSVERYFIRFCLDCKRNVTDLEEMFMVFDEVWLEVVRNRQGMLCVKCFEKRLGRQLVHGDFTHCHLNAGKENKSQLLLDRLGSLIVHGDD